MTIDGNMMNIRVYGKVLNAILDELVTGSTAKDKGFAPVVWRYSNRFIQSMIEGYLSGDGHWEENNHRWRLGFTRNYNLERDLRTACARLGWHLVLNLASVPYNGTDALTFRGELRMTRSGHRNERQSTEIVEIRKARCRYVYDVGVDGEPHQFALASGILTHNSKPNPMPESVTDRPTRSHEYIFLLTKSARYWYDAKAIREENSPTGMPYGASNSRKAQEVVDATGQRKLGRNSGVGPRTFERRVEMATSGRNARSVWTIATKPFKGAHFATYPPELAKRCILAGCPSDGIVLDPFSGSGTTVYVAHGCGRKAIGLDLNMDYCRMAQERNGFL
jgi:hypothetical protein